MTLKTDDEGPPSGGPGVPVHLTAGRFVVLTAAIAVYSTVALSQPARQTTPGSVMPKLPATAATVEALVPQGWAIEQRHDAHFNRDRKTDVLLLLRQDAAEAATPLRVLLVALATATPGGYALAEANARLVPRDPSGAIEDPMADGEITVRPREFDLKIGMTPGVGSYIGATMRYRFRLEGGCFRLIRYDRMETHRGTLDTTDLSVHFLDRVVIHRTGNEQSDEGRTRRERLRNNPRRCLADLGNGWTFDPLPPAR